MLYVGSQNPNLHSPPEKSGGRFLLNVIPDCIRHSICLKCYTDLDKAIICDHGQDPFQCNNSWFIVAQKHSLRHTSIYCSCQKQDAGNWVTASFKGNASCGNDGIGRPPALCGKTWSRRILVQGIKGLPRMRSYLLSVWFPLVIPLPHIWTRISRRDRPRSQPVRWHK